MSKVSELRPVYLIAGFIVLIQSFVCFGQPTERSAYDLLARAESPDALSSGDFEIHYIIATPLFLDMDGKRIIDFQRTSFSSADTLPGWLHGLNPGQIYTERTDSAVNMVRSFGYDSVLCYRVASIMLPANYSPFQIDSALKMAQSGVNNINEWNALSLHTSSREQKLRQEVKGDLLWQECGGLMTDLQHAILTHQVGEVFECAVRYPDGKLCHFIIYKTHPDTYFRRNIFAGISLPVK